MSKTAFGVKLFKIVVEFRLSTLLNRNLTLYRKSVISTVTSSYLSTSYTFSSLTYPLGALTSFTYTFEYCFLIFPLEFPFESVAAMVII